MTTISLSAEHANQRLDKVLVLLFPQFSRAYLQQALKEGKITIDGKTQPAKYLVKGDEQIDVLLEEPSPQDDSIAPEPIPLDIIFEDDAFLIINKPVGLVVHPGAGNTSGTLVNALLYHCPQLVQLPRAGIVHRLDKDTSGLLIVAKTREAHFSCVQQLQERDVHRSYVALVYGAVTAGGTIEGDIGRDPRDRLKMALVESGKPAVTHYRLLEKFDGFTLLRVELETGRTHQIRVHLSSKNYAIVGDPLYGKGLRLPKGADESLKKGLREFRHQALHAAELRFLHPVTQEEVSFSAPLPEDFEALLKLLRR